VRKILLVAVAAIATLAVVISAATAQPARPAAKKPNIVQVASKAGDFKTLVALVKKAGLAGTLSGKGPFTVFAPTDAAFKKVPKETLDALAKNKKKLRAVLLYHVVKGKVPASKVVTLDSAKTLNGQSVSIEVKDGKVYVNDAQVTTPDVRARNGIIHVVDTVLIPN
jgi:uncharacterized surface protein with fasciclin (FAS1) repeats